MGEPSLLLNVPTSPLSLKCALVDVSAELAEYCATAHGGEKGASVIHH